MTKLFLYLFEIQYVVVTIHIAILVECYFGTKRRVLKSYVF